MYEVFEMLCEQRGVTVAEVSRSTGVSQSTLSNWKKRRNNLSAANAKKIADYFGVDVGFLMTGVQQDAHLHTYYQNERAYEMAMKIFKNRKLRMLFDAAEDVDPEDLELVINMVKRFKRTNDSDE